MVMTKQNIGKIAGLMVATGLLCAAGPANATLTFTLNSVFNGSTPTSTSPWMTATFQNQGVGVLLTLTSSLNVPSEFIDEVAFNVKPSITPSSITAMNTTPGDPIVMGVYGPSGSGTMYHPDMQNAQVLNGSGNQHFDMMIKWTTANSDSGIHRFNGTDVEVFTFLLTGLTENDFNYANANGYFIGAHVQGIPGGLSGAITAVPEPTTIIAGALLLMPFGASTFRILRRNRRA